MGLAASPISRGPLHLPIARGGPGAARPFRGASTQAIAAVLVATGQSLNSIRNTIVQATTTLGKMPVGGASIKNWAFSATNEEHVGHWSELASAVDFTEETLQSPLVGMIDGIKSAFSQVYAGTIAIGARPLDKLHAANTAQNAQAMIWRLCELARAGGYIPKVQFYHAHSEANAAAGTLEQPYFDQDMAYLTQLQAWAAQAMGEPAYFAPVVLDVPAPGTITGLTYQEVKAAIRRVAAELPNGIYMGGKYHWECEADRAHQVAPACVQRGEAAGRLLAQHYLGETIEEALEVVSAVIEGGGTMLATFNHNIVRDAAFENFGTVFTEAPDGFEWYDNGSAVTISNIEYLANAVRLTPAAPISGTADQQQLRIASQTHTGSLAVWPENIAGSLIRVDEAGWASSIDPSYINYRWASPQVFNDVEAA